MAAFASYDLFQIKRVGMHSAESDSWSTHPILIIHAKAG